MAGATPSSPAPAEASRDPTPHIVPEDDDKVDNALEFFETGSDGLSSSNSLSSSVLNYQYENGRRYHAYREGEYMVPNDEREQDRMDLHHHIFRLLLDGHLYRAPIGPNPERILDIGTGTGIWAIDMADEFPRATVIGTDLSPIQPGWVPPNCYFEVDDYESTWDFSRPFDFVHARALVGAMKDPLAIFSQALENLKPGGWFEVAEIAPMCYSDDDTIQNAPNSVEWCKVLDEASIKFGKRMNVTHLYKQWLIDVGFENVREDIYKLPLSPWAKDPKLKELGAYQQHNMLEAVEAYTLALMTRVGGWSADQVQVFLSGVRKEMMDRKIHMYAKVYLVYGQKGKAQKGEAQKKTQEEKTQQKTQEGELQKKEA